MSYLIETERLGLRELALEDFAALCVFLQDLDVMYAWEYAFSDEQVREFIKTSKRAMKQTVLDTTRR